LAAALVLVGLLGVALNAIVIAGVRQAQQCRDNTHQENQRRQAFYRVVWLKELKRYTVNKLFDNPVPSRDVTYQILIGQE
jgi:hypothetical protein